MKVLAVIPARGGSKRLAGKNTRALAGVPLIGWSGRFAARCDVFTHIVLSTDDAGIAEVGRAQGMTVAALRPGHLASDTATSADVALHELDRAEAAHGPFDALALLQPTSPFRNAASWREARDLLAGGAPAAIGLAPTQTAPHHSFEVTEGRLTPLFPQGLGMRGQDLPQTVYVTGGLYLIRTDVLRATGSFFPTGTAPVVCTDPTDRIDIDTAEDFQEAEWAVTRYGVEVPPAI